MNRDHRRRNSPDVAGPAPGEALQPAVNLPLADLKDANAVELIEEDQLNLAVEAITRGDLVVMPTNRWYVICADATNTRACDRPRTGRREQRRRRALSGQSSETPRRQARHVSPPVARSGCARGRASRR